MNLVDAIHPKLIAIGTGVSLMCFNILAQIPVTPGSLEEIGKFSAVVFNCLFAMGCLYIIYYGVRVHSQSIVQLSKALEAFSAAMEQITDVYAKTLRKTREND